MGPIGPRVTPAPYDGTMIKPVAPALSDRLGNPIPAVPGVEDLERHADRLVVVAETELADESLHRIPPEDLERRRSEALGR